MGPYLGRAAIDSCAGIYTRPPDLLVRADREAVPLLAQTGEPVPDSLVVACRDSAPLLALICQTHTDWSTG